MVGGCAMGQVWRSEGDFLESLLFSYRMDSRELNSGSQAWQ